MPILFLCGKMHDMKNVDTVPAKNDKDIVNIYGIKRRVALSGRKTALVFFLDLVTILALYMLWGNKLIRYVKSEYANGGVTILLILLVIGIPVITIALVNFVFYVIIGTKKIESR